MAGQQFVAELSQDPHQEGGVLYLNSIPLMHPGQDGLQLKVSQAKVTYGKGRCYNYCKFATVFVVEPSHDAEVIAICNLNTGMNQFDTGRLIQQLPFRAYPVACLGSTLSSVIKT